LVGLSRFTLVGTTTDASSRWESVGSSRRIVTYSRVEVTQPLDGRSPPDTAVMIRTLGGRVGDIGQLVHGEARLKIGEPTVVFLTTDVDGLMAVTAMAQGHYPLTSVTREPPRLRPSPSMPALMNVEGCAVQQLVDRTVIEAEDLISKNMPTR
jgi:hypothetical protein